MASFSFDAGNARKLLRIPLYVAGRLATVFIPRSRDEWVFGCAVGVADGALALWDVAAADGVRAVWLTADDREAADAGARGIRSVPRDCLRGFWRTARARVVVVTHGFGDVNRYAVGGAFVVQLWHGIPLKRIGLDSPVTTHIAAVPGARGLERLLAFLYRRTAAGIDVLPAASHLVRGRLESAFGLPDARVPVTGEPRVDVLSRGTAAARRADARRRLEAAVGPLPPLVVLYAPTWRDGAPDPAIPTPAEWAVLVEVLQRRDAGMLVRSHPLGAGEYRPPTATDRVRTLGSDLVPDVTPLLPGLDALVTDYSSLLFDGALVPLPVVLLAPDLEEYSRTRGFYGRYDDVAEGEVSAGWIEAVAELESVLCGGEERERRLRRSRELSRRVHAFRDGQNTSRVYRAIRERLRHSRRAGRGAR